MILKLILATSLLSSPHPGYVEKAHSIDSGDSIYLGSVYFKYNSSVLTPEGLRQVAYLSDQWRQRCGTLCDGTVKVVGYADNSGHSEYNMRLGLRRAEETAGVLEKLGVNMTNARVGSYGDSRSLSRAQQFRRVEVWVNMAAPLDMGQAVGKDKTVLYLILFSIFIVVVGALALLLVLMLKPKRRPDYY